MVKYLTPEGLIKIKKELNELETVGRKEMAKRIGHAISFGDLSENAAYDEAKESQGFLEGRILELKQIIGEAKIIQKTASGMVEIGSIVLVSICNKKDKFQIVGVNEVDISKGKISFESPLGKAFLGKREGSIVKINMGENHIEYKIINIE